MTRRTVDPQLAQRVGSAAYDLLADGRNPTVRAIRERVRASTNEVTVALAAWRQGLKAQLEARLVDYGIPSHVAEFVRLGILAAEQLRAHSEATDPASVADELERTNGALQGQVRLLERERGDLRETIGRLHAEVSIARARAAAREQAQQALAAARETAGALRVELTEARARAARVEILEEQLAEARDALATARVELAAARAPRRRPRTPPPAAPRPTTRPAPRPTTRRTARSATLKRARPAARTAGAAKRPAPARGKMRGASAPRSGTGAARGGGQVTRKGGGRGAGARPRR